MHDWAYLGSCHLATEFGTWVADLDRRLSDVPYVVSFRCNAAKRAKALAAQDLAERRKSWASWLHKGPAAGLGRQYRMSRVAGGWIPALIAAMHEEQDFDVDDLVGYSLGDAVSCTNPIGESRCIVSKRLTLKPRGGRPFGKPIATRHYRCDQKCSEPPPPTVRQCGAALV